MPIKILQLINAFTTGGAELMAKRLALGYDRNRIRSDIWSIGASHLPEIGQVFRADLDREGIAHGCFKKRPRLKDPRVVLRLASLIRRQGYQVVHAHCDSPGFYGRLAAGWMRGVRTMVTVHSHMPPRTVALERFLSPLTDLYVACSSETMSDLRDRCGISETKVSRILNGIDEDRTKKVVAERQEIRERYGVSAVDSVALVLGRLSPQKAQLDVLEALVHPGERLERLHVWMVGDDRADPAYAQRIQSFLSTANLGQRVKVLGVVPEHQLDEMLKGADLFLLPSEREGLSVAILEALAAGIPTVISDLPNNREATDNGRVAWLVRPHAPDELAATLERLLSDPAASRARGRSAAEFVRAEFSFERVLEDYSRAYERLAPSVQTAQ